MEPQLTARESLAWGPVPVTDLSNLGVNKRLATRLLVT